MSANLKKKTFANEAEEAAWWEANEDALAAEFEKATAEGRTGVGTVANRAALRTTTIRLDPEDISKSASGMMFPGPNVRLWGTRITCATGQKKRRRS